MSILRTIAMFVYLFGYMIVHYGVLRRAERLLAAGDTEAVRAIVVQHIPHWAKGILRYLDGSLPAPDSDDDWWNMVYRWTDCPVLAALDLGAYRADTTHAEGGDSQEYLAPFYIGMRGAWNTATADNLAGGEELWQALTAGAASTAREE